VAGKSAQAVEELSKFRKAVRLLQDPAKQRAAAKFITTKTADYLTGFEEVSVTHRRDQGITVYDIYPPTLEIGTPNLVLEASDFGGVALQRVRKQIFADVTATDACGRPVTLENDLPALVPLGSTAVTWSVSDLGPIDASGGVHTVTKTQTITVRDTQAPIMVPPPGRVVEVDPAGRDPSDGMDARGIVPARVALGVPRVVDLADPMPTVRSDAPAFFPVNSRTEVLWTATDHGFPQANTSQGTQLITVKELGTNTAPVVADQRVRTLTSRPIDIRLTGLDRDMLGGRVDPLSFEIVERPAQGEFIAPLFPFFIEDYRTDPAGPFGQEFLESGNRTRWVYDNFCRKGLRIPTDFVYRPRFVQVRDDGTVYMLDTYWKCNPSDATAGGPRISKWDKEGNFLGQTDYGGTNDAFVLDEDGFIYVNNRTGAGSSTTLTVSRLRPDFDRHPGSPLDDAWRFDFNSTGDDPVSNSQYSYARVDSDNGLVYVNDRRRVFVFDIREDLADPNRSFQNGMGHRYLGALKAGEQFLGVGSCSTGSSWTGFAMDVDSSGSLYVADTCAHRIHKFEPSFFNDDGEFVLGDYVGWMGRCESSTNKACDEDRQLSKGYSCTDQTCSVALNRRHGEGAGQFTNPVYLALDPNDILYVADSGNDRVQRFAVDGGFAGEARSTGTGINRGERPSFVLGNMGRPKAVSVNSSRFYVVDVDESFIHVFETSPFKEITDSAVTVTYVSRFDFHSATDRFTYRASDGLADSGPGTVSIDVSRNFRRPLAVPATLSAAEDTPLEIVLEGDDPDGIVGIDFNGLDTLSYRITQGPRHGTLQGSGAHQTYTPDPDYFGQDSFRFRTDDGRQTSRPAQVLITVEPVDDPPRLISLRLPARAGVGFPVVASGEFRDDGALGHDIRVEWGQEATDLGGDFFDPDGDGPRPPELRGAKLMAPPLGEGVGIGIAQHTFTTPSAQVIRYCISDDRGREDCLSGELKVEPLVNLGVSAAASKATIDSDTTDVEIVVTNMPPQGVAGRIAREITIVQSGSEALRLKRYVVRPPGCSSAKGAISCTAGDLAPGETYRLVARFERRASLLYDQDEPLRVEVTTGTPAVQDVYTGVASIRVLADKTDSDGDGMSDRFEKLYRLHPQSSADAAKDRDGDGLSNLVEFTARSNPRSVDSDGDGLTDPQELSRGLDPANADSDGDRMPDKWELDNGLDPLDFDDGALDLDHDGVLNRDEYGRGLDPNDPDTDGDGLRDDVDLASLIRVNRDAGIISIINTLLMDTRE